jgi:hypothetical protein
MLSLVPRRIAVMTSAFVPVPVVVPSWLSTPSNTDSSAALN